MASQTALKSRPQFTQEERRAQSDRAMLLAAIELIARHGHGATTLEQIGLRAGYSRGLVTQRFGSKEGLARVLVEAVHAELNAYLDPADAGVASGIDAILHIVDRYVGAFAERQLDADPERMIAVQAYFVLMTESIGVVPEMRDLFIQMNVQFRRGLEIHLTAAQRAGQMRADLAVATAATIIQSALNGFTLIWLVDRNAVDPVDARRALVETIRRALQP